MNTAIIGEEGMGKTLMLKGLLSYGARGYDKIYILDLSGKIPKDLIQTTIEGCGDYTKVKSLDPPVATLLNLSFDNSLRTLVVVEELHRLRYEEWQEVIIWLRNMCNSPKLDVLITAYSISKEYQAACNFSRVLKLEDGEI